MAGRKLHPEILRRLFELAAFFVFGPGNAILLNGVLVGSQPKLAHRLSPLPVAMRMNWPHLSVLLTPLESALPSLARICGKQRTYGKPKSFRFCTYKKGVGRGGPTQRYAPGTSLAAW